MLCLKFKYYQKAVMNLLIILNSNVLQITSDQSDIFLPLCSAPYNCTALVGSGIKCNAWIVPTNFPLPPFPLSPLFWGKKIGEKICCNLVNWFTQEASPCCCKTHFWQKKDNAKRYRKREQANLLTQIYYALFTNYVISILKSLFLPFPTCPLFVNGTLNKNAIVHNSC